MRNITSQQCLLLSLKQPLLIMFLSHHNKIILTRMLHQAGYSMTSVYSVDMFGLN